jgi:hypothetical protein
MLALCNPSRLLNNILQVYPVPSFVDDSSGALPENDRLQRMRDRVAQMEKDMRNTYALAAIVNKKNELVTDTERYALTELHKAAESLNCKCPDPLCFISFLKCTSSSSADSFASHSSEQG